MQSYEHLLIGSLIAGVLLFIISKTGIFQFELTIINLAIVGLIVYLYSQLPDIDSDISIINKIWNTSAGALAFYSFYTGKYKLLGFIAIGSIIALEWIKHRGICHNEIFILILSAPLWLINPVFAIIAAATGIGHIIADRDFMK